MTIQFKDIHSRRCRNHAGARRPRRAVRPQSPRGRVGDNAPPPTPHPPCPYPPRARGCSCRTRRHGDRASPPPAAIHRPPQTPDGASNSTTSSSPRFHAHRSSQGHDRDLHDRLAADRRAVPLSADDLLLNVSGVFVNSSLGEIRGMFTRAAISADSSDGATASITSSMQEDACRSPTSRSANYNASYFNRPDATLQRVEAVRGARFHHLVQLARRRVQLHQPRRPADFGGEIPRARGHRGRVSPTHRTDVVMGGPVARTGWVYSLGGFYRYAEGHRPATVIR